MTTACVVCSEPSIGEISHLPACGDRGCRETLARILSILWAEGLVSRQPYFDSLAAIGAAASRGPRQRSLYCAHCRTAPATRMVAGLDVCDSENCANFAAGH